MSYSFFCIPHLKIIEPNWRSQAWCVLQLPFFSFCGLCLRWHRICIYLCTSISFCFIIFLIIFATRFSSLFFCFFFPEGEDWPESASTSTLSLFAELKCPSFVLFFLCVFSPLPAVTCSAWNVQMARAQTHLQTLVYSQTHRIHTRVQRENTHFLHGSFCHPLPVFSLSSTRKKAPNNHFFDKVFLGAFLPCHAIFEVKKKSRMWLTFFDSFSAFREREKRRSLPKAFRMSFRFFWFLFFCFFKQKKAVLTEVPQCLILLIGCVFLFVFCL